MGININIGDANLGITRDDIREIFEEDACGALDEDALERAIEEVIDHAHNLDLNELARFLVEQSGAEVEEDE